jgi:hypothetical protein
MSLVGRVRVIVIVGMTAAAGIIMLMGRGFAGAGQAGQQYHHDAGEQYDNKCDHLG